MKAEDFIAVARHALVPMLLLDGEGIILAHTGPWHEVLDPSQQGPIGRTLADIIADPGDSVQEFLRSASRSRDLFPQNFRLKAASSSAADRQECILEGALLTPGLRPKERRLLIRLRQREELYKNFRALNQKVEELTAEVSRRKLLEAEKSRLLAAEQQARREAETANRTKDEFLAMISHELRTPMNVIKGWADLLNYGLLADAEYPEVFQAISRNADREVQLINDLLDVSRIISGKLQLSCQAIELKPLVLAALDSVQAAAQNRQVHITAKIAAEPGPIVGDPARVQQVIQNLLMNAIKFSSQGGLITLSLEQDGTFARICIQDQGIGIDPNFLPYVFESFRREDGSETRRYGGLGVGLTIVRHIVESLGGHVQASSEGHGKGASFVVNLPLVSPLAIRPLSPQLSHPL